MRDALRQSLGYKTPQKYKAEWNKTRSQPSGD